MCNSRVGSFACRKDAMKLQFMFTFSHFLRRSREGGGMGEGGRRRWLGRCDAFDEPFDGVLFNNSGSKRDIRDISLNLIPRCGQDGGFIWILGLGLCFKKGNDWANE